MRRLSREYLLLVLVALPVIALAALWIKSYWGNDYVFWRWMKVTDEDGDDVEFNSRTPQQWQLYPGSKFQTRYLAVASRRGGVCIGLVLGRYVETEGVDSTLLLFLLQRARGRDHGGRSIGIGHSAWTEYPLDEENRKYGFGYQNLLYTRPEEKEIAYREHWAVV